jgi:hypothetical protein
MLRLPTSSVRSTSSGGYSNLFSLISFLIRREIFELGEANNDGDEAEVLEDDGLEVIVLDDEVETGDSPPETEDEDIDGNALGVRSP